MRSPSRRPGRVFWLRQLAAHLSLWLTLVSSGLVIARAQSGAAPASPPQNPAETTTREEPATFKARVNLVLVPVVVRDRQGRAVGSLKQEDFQLFDKGKPQVISKFSIEKSAGRAAIAAPASAANAAGKSPEQAVPLDMPERFVAYLFDDVHLVFGDLARVRDAAGRHMTASLQPTDRAAVYSTSGQTMLEFTDDRDKLQETLLRLQPRPIARSMVMECPDVSYYLADMIQNKNDPMALQAATLETMACMHMDSSQRSAAEQMARAAAQQALGSGDQETRVALRVLNDVVRRMSVMPGQRIVILASPGFVTPELQQEKTDILDRAIRSNVIINSLDARGLYTDSAYDASRQTVTTAASTIKAQYDRDAERAQADVLAELASGTGGAFFENSNDLDEGFKRVAAAPEYFYVLGFSPQNLKLDGSFHALKVSLKPQADLGLSARRGYYAPKHLSDEVETARREIEEALFSREEMRDIPVDLHTQFFKSTDQSARIALLVRVDVRHLRFRKEDGRNRNDLTVVSGLFDRNGNYVIGNQKRIEMRLRDETLERRLGSGLTVRTSFDVKPGSYMIRLVVRDAEGQLMAAENGAVEIP
ncbi:MAG: VWA domain-containing protein [Bryobacteraceae bacterium]